MKRHSTIVKQYCHFLRAVLESKWNNELENLQKLFSIIYAVKAAKFSGFNKCLEKHKYPADVSNRSIKDTAETSGKARALCQGAEQR